MIFDYANFKKSISQERFEMREIEITSDMIAQARIRSDKSKTHMIMISFLKMAQLLM